MTIPVDFSVEVVERCLKLLEQLEPKVATLRGASWGNNLSTTFLLTMAMPLLVIPIERLWDAKKNSASAEATSVSPELAKKVNDVFLRPFKRAPFTKSSIWYLAEDSPSSLPTITPLCSVFRQNVDDNSTCAILRLLRNALAHGDIFYLNSNFCRAEKTEATTLSFEAEIPNKPELHRFLFVTQEDFRKFLYAWATWLAAAYCLTDQAWILQRHDPVF